MRLRFTSRALADLDSILAFIAERNPHGAQRVIRRIRLMTELLPRYPHLGRVTDMADIRRLIVTPYPFIILYETSEDDVIVHAVRHAARADIAPHG